MEIVDRLDDFIRSYYDTELVKASSGDKALIIDFSTFDRFDPLLADQLLEDPENTIKVFDEAANRIANDTVRVRVRNLPESRGIRIRNLRAKHLGKFLSIDAIIKAASEVKPQIYEAIFVCPECSTKLTLPQETNIVQKPTQCECGRRGDFKMLGTKMYDIRWLTAIEPFEITSGEQAGQISIMLKEDLTTPRMQKKTDPGSRLRISGILKELPKRIKGKMSTKMDMYVLANHVETSEIEFDDLEITPGEEKIIKDFSADPNIYEKLIASIAPGIYGFDDIKESIVLQLFGGVPHTLPDGSRIRGNIHILLTGDPGVGKSVSGESAILHNSDAGPEFTTVGGLVNKALEEHKIRDEDGAEISLKNETGIKVLTLNPDNGSVEWKPVTAFIRHTSPETMVKVTTKSGREVTATACHSFVHMDSGGNIESIRGDKLSDKVYLPIPIGSQKELLSEISTGAQKKITNARLLPQKIKLDWNFGFFLGMFIAEGSCSGGHVNIESRNAERRKFVKSFVDGIGLNTKETHENVRVHSRRLVSLLRDLCYDKRTLSKPGIKGSGAIRKKIPDFCFFGPNEFVRGLLSGLFSGDGYFVNVQPKNGRTKPSLKIGFGTVSKPLANGLLELLSLMGIFAKIRKKPYTYKGVQKESYEILVVGGHAEKLLSRIRMVGKNKSVERFSQKDSFDVLPCTNLLYEIVKSLNFLSKKHVESHQRRSFAAMMRTVKARGRTGRRRIERIYKYLDAEAEKTKNPKAKQLLSKLRKILDMPVVWDQVKTIEVVPKNEKYVYDLSVDGNETFVANNLVVHNTVLLKLVSTIVPRGRYVSGSGVSGAGLTATVVKNEAIGGWVLEAGALILCNKGLISIDEFDKMSRDDQIAMHEATSVETVSIAKASIVATLPAQTAVLAGANPKLGRFDPYVPITEQINIPETLLSRFDLKFALRDIPDRVRDEKIAGHVITSRTTPDFIEPPIDTHLLRKYIAYAKSATNVELLPEAGELLKNFYIEMRNQYPSEGVQPVSITLRQYEALIRLAEASAKVRLDTKVRLHDAERAIRLMKVSLYQLGYDIETGKIDIDRMESGVTASKRRKIGIILEILENLQKELGHEVQKEDLKAEAENQGIVEGVDDIIDRLIREGIIFEPRPGFIRRV